MAKTDKRKIEHGFFIHRPDQSPYTRELLDNLVGLFVSTSISGISTINVMTITISVMARMVDSEEKLQSVMGDIADELNAQMLLLSVPVSESIM